MADSRIRRLLIALAAATATLALAGPAQAASFTVNSAADPGDGTCDASCTLRDAILAANASAGFDDIDFNIGGAGADTISPLTPLPNVTEAVDIDGTTDPSYTAAAFAVELDGFVGTVTDGLRLASSGSTVRGLAIDRFTDNGIEVVSGVNLIAGNFIGSGLNGAATGEGNNGSGIDLDANGTTVGGNTAAARNVISGNATGMRIFGDSNIVQGNYIGADITGVAGLLNANDGIDVLSGDTNTIGGAAAGQRNVISGNGSFGLFVDGTTGGNGNVIKGNYLGLGSNGTTALGNATGLSLQNAADSNQLGGPLAGEGNVISANNASGMSINSADTNTIQGNLIGRDAANTVARGNGNEGIDLGDGDGNQILSNTIAHSSANGVKVVAGTDNTVNSNDIFSNGGLGISLQNNNTIEPNDALDADTGPNNVQNFPVIQQAAINPGTGDIVVRGTLNSKASENYRVEAFASPSCDPSGNGEGADYLSSDSTSSNGAGLAQFQVTAAGVSAGDAVTVTATDQTTGDTSEFSTCKSAVDGYAVTQTTDGAPGACDANCTLREAINAANSDGDATNILFNLTGSLPQTINPGTPLPIVTTPVTIDGTSQPGFAPPSRAIELDGTGLPAGTNGIHLSTGSSGSTIRGLAVNRFTDVDPMVPTTGFKVDSDNNTVVGNYVGTSPAGNTALGNDYGIWVGGNDNTIGSATAGDANVVSGNGDFGLLINPGTGNTVRGNLVGVGADGTTDLGNNNVGVSVQGSGANNVIGGTGPGERNVISGNTYGVYTNGGVAGTNIVNNTIGTNAAQTAARPNTVSGVDLNSPTSTVTQNLIANSGASGVRVGANGGNKIVANNIRDNGGLGIDLAKLSEPANTVTPNDPGDVDNGPNNLQNHPVLTRLAINGASATVDGYLDSEPGHKYVFGLFKSSACDASGYGEGATIAGTSNGPGGLGWTANSAGRVFFSFTTSAAAVSGGVLTATTTDIAPFGSTSEFSPCGLHPLALGPIANLSVSLVASDQTPEPGEAFSYVATVTNNGPAAANSPKVTVTLPESVRYLSAAIAQAGSGCSSSGTKVTCGFSTMPAGSSAKRSIRVKPTKSGKLVATAVASGDNSSATSSSESVAAKLPKPAVARQVNVRAVSGKVTIKQPGQKSFRRLDGEDRIRVGSSVDTRSGRVRLTSAAGGGKTQTADFYDGIFKVLQSRGKRPVTELRLVGKLENCGKAKKSDAFASKKRRGRRLWGNGKGRFRTRGKRSAATVRGTIWLVEDRCNDTTFTRVRRGVVSVRDFGRRKTITVRKGKTYTARPRKK